MRHILKLEFIGHDRYSMAKKYPKQIQQTVNNMGIRQMINFYKCPPSKPWVAEILGLNTEYQFTRKFLKGQIDYSEASGVGSRNVFMYFILQPSTIYEINHPKTWRNTDRYFLIIEGNDKKRLTREEVIECCLKSF